MIIGEKIKKLKNKSNRKNVADYLTNLFLLVLTIIGAAIIIFIFVIIFVKGIQPFLKGYEYHHINFWDFITGLSWREDFRNVENSLLGVGFIVINTLYITILSVLLVVPLSILTGLFICKIAHNRLSKFLTTVIEILASIPSVIYGLFGAAFIVDIIKIVPETAGGLSTLATVIVLSIMIFPTITTMSVTAIKAVPKTLEEASLALGATEVQTNFKVVLNSAKSGIFAGIILGVGRALGEATAVSMVAGDKSFGPTFGLFDITRTLTTTMLKGIYESQGLLYDIKFSVALVLMVVILLTNAILNFVKKRVGYINE
ncbi:MAG: phosphate transporter permease subunit PstC [Haloplasmataceae bacterium]|jgi:phosphate transport system permease protein|nr:phosphate transporter permease subunit PstC [Haloplasmataceae bacterium]